MLNKSDMEFHEAKSKLIESWGTLGTQWGINKAMAKIHLLLLISPDPLSTDQIMEELNISRGNANLNIRSLIEWGLVHKKLVPGDRKEYFYPIKDMWELLRIVTSERRKREIQPVTKVLDEVSNVANKEDREVGEFLYVVDGMKHLIESADLALDRLEKIEKSKFLKNLLLMK